MFREGYASKILADVYKVIYENKKEEPCGDGDNQQQEQQLNDKNNNGNDENSDNIENDV